MRARLLVPAGAPDHSSGGERSSPSQVYLRGMAASWANAADMSVNAMQASWSGESRGNLIPGPDSIVGRCPREVKLVGCAAPLQEDAKGTLSRSGWTATFPG